ncbi:MAG: Gfo/Idh/MocA family oxidoreductase [Nitrospinae bacterium]|nr:Gfo/Idh/MocA family oxidoreductase [Nitrospinota bacterium]
MIGIGVIGCGYWGPNLIRNLYELEDCRLSAVCDLKEDRLNYIKRRFNGVHTTTDYKEILKSKEIEGVVIATPISTHFDIAKEALISGKDVLVEKPLSSSADKCGELIKIAKDNKRVLMAGHTFIYNAAVRKLKEIMETGDIGDIYYIYSKRLNLGIIRNDVNALWNFAPHDLSILLYLLEKEPVKVGAKGYSFIQKGIEDVVFMTLDFPGNIGAHIHISWLDPNKTRGMTVVGSKKMVVYNDLSPDAKIIIYDKGVMNGFENFGDFQLLLRSGDIHIPKINFKEPLKVECSHFIECIKERKEPLTNGDHGLKVVKILEAAQRSLKEDGIPQSLK